MNPSNPHEANFRLVLQRAFGASGLFLPEERHKRGSTREPADIVWARPDVVILLFLAKKEKGASDDRDRRKFEEAIEHNIDKQAAGALRAWRDQRIPIRGRSATGDISIEYRGQKLVIVSVIDAPAAEARFHFAQAKALGVDLCCTIPGECLRLAAAKGLTVIDVLSLIHWIRVAGLPSRIGEVNQVVVDINRRAWHESGAAKLWPQATDKRFRKLFLQLQNARISVPIGDSTIVVRNPNIASAFFDLFNDLPLVDLLQIVATHQEMLDTLQTKWYEGFAIVRGSFYDFAFAFAAGNPSTSNTNRYVETFIKAQANGQWRLGPSTVVYRNEGVNLHYLSQAPKASHASALCTLEPQKQLWVPPKPTIFRLQGLH